MPRIVFLTDSFLPERAGGIGRYTEVFSAALVSLGFEVDVLVPSVSSFITEMAKVSIHRIQTQTPLPQKYHRNGLPEYILRELNALYTYVEFLHAERPIDLIVASSWHLHALPFQKYGHIPTVLVPVTGYKQIMEIYRSIGESLFEDRNTAAHVLEAEAEMHRSANYIQVSSPAISSLIQNLYGVKSPPAEIFEVPFALPDQGEKPLESSEKNILFVGRFDPRKGVDLVLDAVEDVLANHPDAHFHFVGVDELPSSVPPYKKRFLEKYAEHDLLSKVTFHGYVSDLKLHELYRNASMFVAPSRFESFGIIYIEAMMHGLPIIALKTMGSECIIRDGVEGLLVGQSSQEITGAIVDLLTDQERRYKLGKAARETFLTRYEIGSVASYLASRYRGIIDSAHSLCGQKEPPMP